MKKLYVLFALILTLIFSANYYAQCTSCTVTDPVITGNYTFPSGSTVCFTSNATLNNVTFSNNSKICVAPGVTVRIQNNVTTNSTDNITFEIGGTLQFDQVPSINANLTANVQSGGILRSGTTGTNNFTFNGTTNTLTNNGTVQVSVLGFNNNSSTNIIDNYGTLTIGSNINISGTSTTFRNFNLINIGQSFNMNSTTRYINCGTINTGTGFNVGGGRIINTGNFNVSTSGSGGSLDLPNGSSFENYGILDSRGSTNNNGTTSTIYNEGLVKFNTYQGDGWLRGPSSSSKKGYFEVASILTNNTAKVGPNLDFKRTNTNSSQATVFNATPTYVTSTGSTTTSPTVANVTFDCRAVGNCSAPLVTNIGVCPNIDGTFPPQANDDAYTIAAGGSANSNVLANDFAQFNGAAATTSNVTITQISTTNSGVNVNTSGVVSVAAGTPAGTYTIVYRICSISNTSSCDPATVTVTVPLDSDGDGVPNSLDLDDDNDGILDAVENSACGGVPDPTILSGNGVIINNIFKEDFGTMSTATGTHSVNMTNLGTGATTNYNYYNAVVGTTPTSSNDGGAAPNSLQDNRYTIFNQITYTSTWATTIWQSTLGDHTGGGTIGSGRMFVVNASNNPGEFYRKTLTNIVQGAPINASLWIMNIDTNIAANNGRNLPNITVKFMQGTTELYSYNTGDIPREAPGSSSAWKFFKNPAIFIPTSNANIDLVLVNNARGGAGNDLAIDDIIVYQSFCDFDNDGTPNYLDLDSDGDGCSDAIEGDENVTTSQLTANRISGTVDDNGVPNLVNAGGTADVGSDQGQGIGEAYTVNPAAVGGTASSNQTIVSGATPAALSLSGHTGTIQWQSSTDNVTFTNISGATSATYAPGALTATTYYRAVVSSLGGCSVNTNSVVITVVPNTDSDGDGIVDYYDLDDDNDGILDTTEGQCINTSNPSTDGFDSPLVATVNGNNIQSVNPYNGWGAETGGANAFNVIRVNGAGYSSGPDVAQSGTQYIDINSSSAYVYKDIILTTPTVFSASAWFANRESSIGAYAPWSTKIEIRNETTGITVAQGNTINFTSSISDEIWNNSSINSVALPAGTYRIRMYVGDFGHLDSISYCFSKDTDGDGTPDHLDLDSDNDGCADALEGDENVTASQLTANRISGTVDANGVPNLVNAGGTADVGSDQGQGIGEAYNAAIQSGCLCYKPAQTTGTALDTNHGITALGRAGADNSNWPMVRKGAWTVLEAKTKGFVINRLTNDQINAIPSADLREGMMVYNITQDCLQINIDGTATGWKCFNTQTCPD